MKVMGTSVPRKGERADHQLWSYGQGMGKPIPAWLIDGSGSPDQALTVTLLTKQSFIKLANQIKSSFTQQSLTWVYRHYWSLSFCSLQTRTTAAKLLSVFHPSIFICLFVAGSWGQLPKQGHPDLPLPTHLFQLIQGNTEAFPGQQRDVIYPACPWSTLGPAPNGTSLKHLARRNAYHIPKPPQLGWEAALLFSHLIGTQCLALSVLNYEKTCTALCKSLRSPITSWYCAEKQQHSLHSLLFFFLNFFQSSGIVLQISWRTF